MAPEVIGFFTTIPRHGRANVLIRAELRLPEGFGRCQGSENKHPVTQVRRNLDFGVGQPFFVAIEIN